MIPGSTSRGHSPLSCSPTRTPTSATSTQPGTFPPEHGTRSMKILFTGGSSFTGSWFIRELAAAGHERHGDLSQARRGIFRRCPAAAGHARFRGLAAPSTAAHSVMRRSWPWSAKEAGTCSAITRPTSPTTRALTSTRSAPLQNNTQNLPAVLRALKVRGLRQDLAHRQRLRRGRRIGLPGLCLTSRPTDCPKP